MSSPPPSMFRQPAQRNPPTPFRGQGAGDGRAARDIDMESRRLRLYERTRREREQLVRNSQVVGGRRSANSVAASAARAQSSSFPVHINKPKDHQHEERELYLLEEGARFLQEEDEKERFAAQQYEEYMQKREVELLGVPQHDEKVKENKQEEKVANIERGNQAKPCDKCNVFPAISSGMCRTCRDMYTDEIPCQSANFYLDCPFYDESKQALFNP